VKVNQVCPNKGPGRLQRGDNHKNVKMGWGHLKVFFSRTSWPNSIKLKTNYPWMKGIQVCSNKGPGPLQRGNNHKKNVKMCWGHLKILSLRTMKPEKAEFYMKAF
jgi:hypothetical protein